MENSVNGMIIIDSRIFIIGLRVTIELSVAS